MKHYGIRGVVLNWFKNKLQINKLTRSNRLDITCGVTQGSVLGSSLLLIYINDIHKSSEILTCMLFADNSNLVLSIKCLNTMQLTMNHELHKITIWLATNELSEFSQNPLHDIQNKANGNTSSIGNS